MWCFITYSTSPKYIILQFAHVPIAHGAIELITTIRIQILFFYKFGHFMDPGNLQQYNKNNFDGNGDIWRETYLGNGNLTGNIFREREFDGEHI